MAFVQGPAVCRRSALSRGAVVWQHSLQAGRGPHPVRMTRQDASLPSSAEPADAAGAKAARRARRPASTAGRSIDRAAIQRALHKTFGIKHLREGQDAVIAHVLAGRPTLAIMPTGAGKSLCYQLPATLLPGTTLVVSPLIALMKDQCDKLRELGVAAVQLNSAVGAEEIAAAEQAIAAGEAKIVFTTPERLAERSFVDLVAR